MKAKHATAVAALGVGLAAWLYATPYIAANALRESARAGDLGAMLERIDVLSVKRHLKADLLALIDQQADSTAGLPFGTFGAALAAAMAEPAVDAFVTPRNLALMVQGHVPSIGLEPAASPDAGGALADAEVRMAYQGLNRFSVSIEPRHGGARDPVTLSFQREGPFTWRLQSVRLPFAGSAPQQRTAEGPRR
ncbi:DUF2939 domain-containing protein [Azohydromonas aeria]|uniref:DUF2939 domain-containing protein n=1 Tax=Azohydromonas aeria TaxID=2590212 RepID=UPI0012F913AF|nr:DUF2939 domain-containing protein [Azohydromonas aeria]